jgi:hypothetical protein
MRPHISRDQIMLGEAHIPLFCAPQRMETEIPAAVHIGGSGAVGASSLVTSCDQAGQLRAMVVAVLYAHHPTPERRK